MRIRRHHVIGTVALIIVVFVVGLVAGWWFGAFHYPYKTHPRPPLPPGQSAPNCSKEPDGQHKLGSCLPQPHAQNAALITATNQGPDLSNNDPVYGDGNWAAIGAHNAFVILKVNESTNYVDQTAGAMAALAKRHGLTVGGYDFLHVCGPNPGDEANVFVAYLKADGLTGPNTLPGTGDAEFGGSGCDARAWMLAWAQQVARLTGRWPMIYTGAWWWQPHLGSYWPNPSLAWISGYGVSYPYMPSGRSQLDIWQFTDAGWNGVSSADLSIWRDGASAFNALAGAALPIGDWLRAKTASLAAWKGGHCGDHPQRPDCVSYRSRVVYYQEQLEQRYPHVHCWGPNRRGSEAVCTVLRPTLAYWARARDSSRREYGLHGCRQSPRADSCPTFAQRDSYFQARIAWALTNH